MPKKILSFRFDRCRLVYPNKYAKIPEVVEPRKHMIKNAMAVLVGARPVPANVSHRTPISVVSGCSVWQGINAIPDDQISVLITESVRHKIVERKTNNDANSLPQNPGSPPDELQSRLIYGADFIGRLRVGLEDLTFREVLNYWFADERAEEYRAIVESLVPAESQDWALAKCKQGGGYSYDNFRGFTALFEGSGGKTVRLRNKEVLRGEPITVVDLSGEVRVVVDKTFAQRYLDMAHAGSFLTTLGDGGTFDLVSCVEMADFLADVV